MTTKDLKLISIHRSVDASAYRELNNRLEVGSYNVDFQARFIGALKKGDPFTQRISAKANPWRLLALALGKMNAKTRAKLVSDSLNVAKEDEEQIKAEVQAEIDRLVSATETEMTGKLTTVLSVLEIE